MGTNILTQNLTIYTDCNFNVDKKLYYPREIRSAVRQQEVILASDNIEELKKLKNYIMTTMKGGKKNAI